jgi:branched-chain amino acid transport system substrate-binding protein
MHGKERFQRGLRGSYGCPCRGEELVKKTTKALLCSTIILSLIVSCEIGSDRGSVPGDAPGISDAEIKIGSSLALSGHAGYLGKQVLQGASCYINYVNDMGGINGRKIKLIAYDDEYDPPRCLANTQKLIVEDKVFALFSYVGTPTTVKIIPLIDESAVPLVGIVSGANELRKPFNRHIINIRASYYQETGSAIEHLIKDLDLKKIAVFYQYDAYGFDGLKGTELALKNYGLTPVATGSYIRGTLNIEEGLTKIINSGAEAVVMIGTYEPCTKFIKSAKAKGYNPLYYAVSFVGIDEFAQSLGKDGEGIIVTQVVPSPGVPEAQTLLGGISGYSELLKKYYPQEKPSFVGFESYINARVLVEGLKRTGKTLTRERFIDAMESIQNYSLGIANALSFSPTDHQGLERVYFTRIENGKITLVTDWQKIKREWSIPGVTADQILLGSSLALSGPAAYLGEETLHGAMSYLNYVNEQGGIHGRRIKVISYDDGYDPSRCVKNTRKLIDEDKVFALFCYVGTATSVEIIPIVEQAKIPLLGLFTGGHILREPFKHYIINVRASYYQETATAVRHFVEDLKFKKVAVFFQDDAYGLDGLKGAQLALKHYGLTPVAVGSYIRGSADVENALHAIESSGAEAVVMAGTYEPCVRFIQLARKDGFNPVFHGLSLVGAEQLVTGLGKDGEGVIITQVVPPPVERVLLPAAEDYVRRLAEYYPKDIPNFVGFEGFINAKILVEGLRRAGREISREGFITAIESMETYFVGIGGSVNFGPRDHQGLDQVYFTVIKDGKLVFITDWETIGR